MAFASPRIEVFRIRNHSSKNVFGGGVYIGNI
jgi:hypothetical protein